MSSRSPVLRAEELTCRYGDFLAVDQVSFVVEPGEIYALLGTNGAGKTTTLEAIEGQRRPSSGRVEVFGAAPRRRAQVRPRIGIMLQDSGFAQELTVSETLAVLGTANRRGDSVDRVLDQVGLGAKRSTRVTQLSGGEQRRLDFAAAIFGGPELLFLDEPTTGLDPAAREQLWRVATRLREHGTTIVLTTHYLEEAEQYADRIGILHRGRLAREGTLAALVAAFPGHIEFRADLAGLAVPAPFEQIPDGRVVLETAAPQADMFRLLAWADDHRLTLDGLRLTPSSLAELFRDVSATPELATATAGGRS